MLVDENVNIYLGQDEITKVYNATNLVYEKNTKPPYTPLQYIQSSGTQYINPNLPNHSNGLRAEFKWSPLNNNINNQFIWGVEGDYPYNRNYFKYSSYYRLELGAYWYLGFNYTTTVLVSYETETNTIKNTTQYVKINGTQVYSTNDYNNQDRSNLTPYIFAINRSGRTEEYGYIRLYYLKFYDENNTLLRDFIPVLDENDVPCLYDQVSQTYFYNQGTGTFGYGLL